MENLDVHLEAEARVLKIEPSIIMEETLNNLAMEQPTMVEDEMTFWNKTPEKVLLPEYDEQQVEMKIKTAQVLEPGTSQDVVRKYKLAETLEEENQSTNTVEDVAPPVQERPKEKSIPVEQQQVMGEPLANIPESTEIQNAVTESLAERNAN
jgi:hypothetical protein